MSGNPPLVTLGGHASPRLYSTEILAISRQHIDIEIDNIPHLHSRWKSRGSLHLTNFRLVFVTDDPDENTGLFAFEIPLAYVISSSFNQPIFFCNNLSGTAWTVSATGVPDESCPPLKWTTYFKNGGVGTFLPLYFRFREDAAGQFRELRTADPSKRRVVRADIQSHVATAIVDPSDPSTLYLTQPDEKDRIPTAPVYAPNYGEDEVYEPL